jgi:hypothetical protein
MAVTQEKGEPTQWDIAWREGYAKALEWTLGIPYKDAWHRAREYWQPGKGWRVRLARWLLRRT